MSVGLELLFRRIAIFAARHAGYGYEKAFKTTLRAHRFFENVPVENEVFAELTDSLMEMPAIAHLAIRGALADPSDDVVTAAQSVLALHPDLRERV
jgi:hypothetical protein